MWTATPLVDDFPREMIQKRWLFHIVSQTEQLKNHLIWRLKRLASLSDISNLSPQSPVVKGWMVLQWRITNICIHAYITMHYSTDRYSTLVHYIK